MKLSNSENQTNMHGGAPPEIFKRAKALRNNMTEAEILLWNKLKGNNLLGLKFRRQHPFQLFILDFYCHKLKLAIEIDGKYHLKPEQRKKDNERTKDIEESGIKIIRFSNEQVINEMDKVLQTIKTICKNRQQNLSL